MSNKQARGTRQKGPANGHKHDGPMVLVGPTVLPDDMGAGSAGTSVSDCSTDEVVEFTDAEVDAHHLEDGVVYPALRDENGKLVLAHEFVMEEKLGRKLLPGEWVEFIRPTHFDGGGNTIDCRPENLELFRLRIENVLLGEGEDVVLYRKDGSVPALDTGAAFLDQLVKDGNEHLISTLSESWLPVIEYWADLDPANRVITSAQRIQRLRARGKRQ